MRYRRGCCGGRYLRAGWGCRWAGRLRTPVSSQDARSSRSCASVVIVVRLGAFGPARYAGNMPPKRRPYPSDLSDARWELIEPVLAAWRFERRGRALAFGRPPEHDLRDIKDAILYVDRTGVQWRYLPHDFPHGNTVYGYFAKWADEGVFAQLNGLLRQLLRERSPMGRVHWWPRVRLRCRRRSRILGIPPGRTGALAPR